MFTLLNLFLSICFKHLFLKKYYHTRDLSNCKFPSENIIYHYVCQSLGNIESLIL